MNISANQITNVCTFRGIFMYLKMYLIIDSTANKSKIQWSEIPGFKHWKAENKKLFLLF